MSSDDSNNQLKKAVEHALLKMMESQRILIRARVMDQGEDLQLRQELQGDIQSAFEALKPYKNRNPEEWESAVLFVTEDSRQVGLDQIDEWSDMTETVERERDDFSGKTETVERKRILPAGALIESATAVCRVADKIGFNAIENNQRPYNNYSE